MLGKTSELLKMTFSRPTLLQEEEEDNDMDTSSGGESAGENASDEEPEEEAGEREDLAKAFPCPGSPTTCTKSFCFACALNT